MGPLSLFEHDGSLNRTRLAPDAMAVLDRCTTWLEQLDRAVYLPIDLMVVLLERGNRSLHRTLSYATRGVENVADLEDKLRTLARRVEREPQPGVRLHRDHFSLGFLGLLQDAWAWAVESERRQLTESDLERVVRWRAELQESASVRWAIRQLSAPTPDQLFHPDERLRAEAFDTGAWTLLRRAANSAARAGLPFLGTPHIVAAAISEGSDLELACRHAGIDSRKVREELLRIVGGKGQSVSEFTLSRRTLTPRLARMLNEAMQGASRRNQVITERDLLAAFIADGGSSLDVLKTLGVLGPLQDRMALPAPHPGAGAVPDPQYVPSMFGPPASGESPPREPAAPASSSPTLDQIGRNLSADAAAGTLPTVLGRDLEIQRVINVLLRSEQRNPLLTGEAGVGKTALAVALAQRIHDGTVPRRLVGMRVVEINGASLVGGTSYRGELEARIRSLLAEAEDNVILFIDEAHAVFAPRTNSGQPAEVPNHFKSALASGRIAVVAATTEAEYHRWIEQDPALRRRFERIEVPELSADVTRTILHQLVGGYEDDYEVTIHSDAVDAAVDLSMRFMPEQSLPDKAKKLLMDAAISVASRFATYLPDSARQAGEPGIVPPAADALTPPPMLDCGLVHLHTSTDGNPAICVEPVVTRLDVATQIAAKTGIPLHRITSSFLDGLAGLEQRLTRVVPGQEPAARELARRLIAGRLAGAGRARPQGVFLFAGPSGAGKSRLASALAVELFGSDRNLIRLNMGDFQEPISLSRLIGSPPGYVGYQDEDALVTPLRRRPSSIVLLRDFELAHPRVQDRLIRLFEEGGITDTRGLRADASHAIFVLTVTCDMSAQRGSIGFGSQRAATEFTLGDLNSDLADRLRGHSVEIIPFRGAADPELAEAMLHERLEAFAGSLSGDFGVQLIVPDSVMNLMRQRCNRVRDLREIERIFHSMIIEPVSNILLHGTSNTTVTVPEPASAAAPVLAR
jgi:ATP-dependent Clp protease ATP-binding subunit ClpC